MSGEGEAPSVPSQVALQALIHLRNKICTNRTSIFSFFSNSPDSNYSKLKFIFSDSLTQGCNNSVLLLGPRGCGHKEVLDLVLNDLKVEFSDMISVVRLDGVLHSDDNCSFKEIAKQLCVENQLLFSKLASSDENSQFMIGVLREYGLAHKTLVVVLDEFDLFAQGKQRLLYSLLDAMQSVSSQAVVVGVSCRLDADQLLEKRVRSRFSHRKLLFLPPSKGDIQRLLEYVLALSEDSSFPADYVIEFNAMLHKILEDNRFQEILCTLSDADPSVDHLLNFLFLTVCDMNLEYGFLTLENFKTAISSIERPCKLESLRGCSVLELYMLACMKRLEDQEQSTSNFNLLLKDYKVIHDTYQISDYYSPSVCLRAFEHLLQRGLICFTDRRQSQSIEFRPVKLLITSHELHQGLKSNRYCPALIQKLVS